MKRKRGHKKGKSKKLQLVETSVAETVVLSPNHDEVVSVDSGGSLGSDEESEKKAETEGETELTKAETPPEKVVKVANVRTDGVIVRPPPTAVYGRVKVKLKASKPPVEPVVVVPASEGPVVSDKSGVEKEGKGKEVVVEKGEDSGNSVPESKKGGGGAGGIKIVSSKGLSPPGGKESGSSGVSPEVEEKKEEEQEVKLEPKVAQRGSRYDKQELEASLEVVKKVMKMDAAEPFNVPVNPIELGIPDYFDVIDTPMDFGTIRSNLESGAKYMNSEDVYNDVQYIWNNCFKYNNKGDYIVDLMKRVKKNFMKYWMAAGLYTEQTKKTIGGEGTPMDEATTSSQGKKFKRGKGVKRHKDDCMCAICIMKRRRREREVREAQEAREAGGQAASPQTEVTKTGLPQDYKQEEHLRTESPGGEDTSSYMETSPDVDADAEMEDGEETRLEGVAPQYDDDQKAEDDRVEFRDKSDRSGDISEKSQRSDKGESESYLHVEAKVQDDTGSRITTEAQKQMSVQPEVQTGHLQQRHELLELERKRQRLRLMETFRDLENPMLLGLCGTLFPNSRRSVWNGANSLVRCQKSCHSSSIREAVASFMTPSCKSAASRK